MGAVRRRRRVDGERLCVRLHAGRPGADDADRSHRRADRAAVRLHRQRACDRSVWHLCRGILVGDHHLVARRIGLRRRLHAGTEGADGPVARRRQLAGGDAVHVELLGRRRPVVPGCAGPRRSLGMAQRVLCHRHWPHRDGARVPADRGTAASAEVRASSQLRTRPRQIARRSATSSVTAPTASSSTAFAPGWSGSGPSSLRIRASRPG